MDHYKRLGVSKTATKEEIKQAFRKLALEYHPDRHSQSPKSLRETATFNFKLISEAYDVLSDDTKRADYNLRSSSSSSSYSTSSRYSHGYGYGYYQNNNNRHGYYRYYYRGGSSYYIMMERAVRYWNSRAFLLNLAFAGTLCSGVVVIDWGREALWKLQNSGKSFEDAMNSIEKAKDRR